MTGLALLVVSIALADSLNPATVIPALYLATVPRPVRAILGFGAGFLVVNLLGGLVVLALGREAASVVPRPSAAALHAIELLAGVACLMAAGLLWAARARTGSAFARVERRSERAAILAGAAIAAAELPTAVPYFVAIAIIAAADHGPLADAALILLFQVVFLAPVAVIALVRGAGGERMDRAAERARAAMLRHAGAAIAVLVGILGVVLLTFGVVGLTA